MQVCVVVSTGEMGRQAVALFSPPECLLKQVGCTGMVGYRRAGMGSPAA